MHLIKVKSILVPPTASARLFTIFIFYYHRLRTTMEDLNIDQISLSENVPAEEKLIKTEKIDQLSDENLKDHHKTSSESKQHEEPTSQSSEESVDKTSKDNFEEKKNETKKLEETVKGKFVKTEITKIESCEITRSKKVDKPEIVEIKQIKKTSDSMPCCPLEEKY